MQNTYSDNQIIDEIRNGNRDAFGLLVKKYQQKVFQSSMGFLHDEDEAADLTQDIFIKVYQQLDKFKGQSSFSTWLFRICVNMGTNHLRKQKIRQFIRPENGAIMIHSQSPNRTDGDLLKLEQKKIIRQALRKLKASQRKAIILSHYQELTNAQLAEVMGLTLKAAESLLFRARTRLQEILKREFKTTSDELPTI
ncbi:RNA polymerase sigma factor [Geofilum sp. OHC36d9]|uniref:RNA polymerase sigma factor n=1 Tax=Geofilum sp. OHC36d9 TaxID=3458413 RepID=UPI0040335114